MSNTLTNLVPSFNGKDFKSYAKKMEAYLAFQGIDNVLTEDKPCPHWRHINGDKRGGAEAV